eukprot:TRINITY_DN712_c7_g1_i1.p1 TRINITY_DN712_c7_g1~~TRINITY_DN712_c7_g1_i1.p1  ORF type:complete len:332 (-),score=17.91 TRINITY_DN712_c7_g1_i1:340-1335(-)
MSQENLGNVKAIQAYRDHRIPLLVTKSRETFTHCIEYRDFKYYSLIKNRTSFLRYQLYIEQGESVLDVNLEKLLLSNTKVVINCIEINRKLMYLLIIYQILRVNSIQLAYLYDGIDKLWLQFVESCYVSEPSYEHKSIQISEIVESSFQLRNFAEVAVQLPKLIPRKKTSPEQYGVNYTKDLRTMTMRWPKEILKVHKSAVSLKPMQKTAPKFVKVTRPTFKKQDPEKLRIDSGGSLQSQQLPLAINKYIRPSKQSPKAMLYYKGKFNKDMEELKLRKTQYNFMQMQQQCCGSFCNYAKIPVTKNILAIDYRGPVENEANKPETFGDSQRI